MTDTNALKNRIRAAIKANDNQEITGPVLQQTLLDIVDELNTNPELASDIAELEGRIDTLQITIDSINTKLAEGYIYVGIATPSTNPGTLNGKVFYVAVQAGTYTNFSNIPVTGGITILKNNGSGWLKDVVLSIDQYPTKGSNNPVESGGVWTKLNTFCRISREEISKSDKEQYITIIDDDNNEIIKILPVAIDVKKNIVKENNIALFTGKFISVLKNPTDEESIEITDNNGNILMRITPSVFEINNTLLRLNGSVIGYTDNISEESIEITDNNSNVLVRITPSVFEINNTLRLNGSVIGDTNNINAESLRSVIPNLNLSDYPISGNVICLGDSTIAGTGSGVKVSDLLTITGTLVDISYPGDTIAGQKTKWNNDVTAEQKSAANYIFVEIGLNDLTNSYSDTNRYSGLVNLIKTIRSDSPNAKVIVCTMTPALQRFKDMFPSNWEVVYNNWLELNNSIKNQLIYGANTSAWFHSLVLGDLNGNLLPQYEGEDVDHIHLNQAGVKVIAWSWLMSIYK